MHEIIHQYSNPSGEHMYEMVKKQGEHELRESLLTKNSLAAANSWLMCGESTRKSFATSDALHRRMRVRMGLVTQTIGRVVGSKSALNFALYCAEVLLFAYVIHESSSVYSSGRCLKMV